MSFRFFKRKSVVTSPVNVEKQFHMAPEEAQQIEMAGREQSKYVELARKYAENNVHTQLKAVLKVYPIEENKVIDDNINIDDLTRIHGHPRNWSWKFWKREIFSKIKKIYTESKYLEKSRYQLFTMQLFEPILRILARKYKQHYSTGWTLDGSPEFDQNSVWTKDQVFIEKLNVSDDATVVLIGDLHSSFHSLMHIFDKIRSTNDDIFDGNTLKLKPNHYLIFLGDIVDRGPYSLELLFIIFIMKLINFKQLYIINGNHEDCRTYRRYGLNDEIELQFNVPKPIKYPPKKKRNMYF